MISKLSLSKAILLLTMPFLTSCFIIKGGPSYEGPKSDHFDGEKFSNRVTIEREFLDFYKMRFSEDWSMWPEKIEIEQKKIGKENPSVTFIGHSTFLIREDGLNILTDPVYSERASPVTFTGPKRVRKPAVKFADLPKIDVILISHNHYDHLDIETLKKFGKRDNPLIIVGLGVDLLLKEEGLNNVIALDWSDSHKFKEVEFTFLECQHFSSRGILDRNETLWGSYGIFFKNKSVYFAGDTGYSPHFKEQGEKYSSFDLALIPIGAYEPRWFMKHVHLNPEDAVLAHKDLNAKKSLGTHFGTFQLTAEKIADPGKDLKAALKKHNVSENNFLVPGFGSTYKF